jgi:DNA-binding MarR family transcriptional regulator
MQHQDRTPVVTCWVQLLEKLMSASIRCGPELTVRQLVAFLRIYLRPENIYTVRGLAAEMGVPKNVIVRAFDRLEALGLLRRKEDPSDGRSIIAARTSSGLTFLYSFGDHLASAMEHAGRDVPGAPVPLAWKHEIARVALSVGEALHALTEVQDSTTAAFQSLDLARADLAAWQSTQQQDERGGAERTDSSATPNGKAGIGHPKRRPRKSMDH